MLAALIRSTRHDTPAIETGLWRTRSFALANLASLLYGAALFTDSGFFALPGFPLEDVRDPTGAGDSFAGGFLGYLDAVRIAGGHDDRALRQAMAYGSVMASFNVEDFGTERVSSLTEAEIADRLSAFKRLTHFEEAPIAR